MINSSTRSGRQFWAGVVGIAMLVAACTDGSAAPSTTPASTIVGSTSQPNTNVPGLAESDASGQLGLRLSQGVASTEPTQPSVPVVSATDPDENRIDDSGVAEIFSRLPTWEDDKTLDEAFTWPTQSRPAPRAGSVVDLPFPASSEQPAPAVPDGPLKVLRYQPEGDVPLAPAISVTFNQPMVPLGTVGQVDALKVPITISPAVPGSWQWIGTRTARFDASSTVVDRLPMATSYTVTVPAGIVSASGAALAETVTWSFATPPVTVGVLSPQGDNLARQPIFVVTFDQLIDRQAVLDTVAIDAKGDVPVRLATDAEVAADDVAAALVAAHPAGRWLAFTPSQPMPTDTAVTITVGPGTPSQEGPATTPDAATYTGRTYAPLSITDSSCPKAAPCPPSSELGSIVFNNELDPTTLDASTIVVQPNLAGLALNTYGNIVNISGATEPNTVYTVTLSASIADTYGQTLGTERTLNLTIGTSGPMLTQLPALVTLDPMAKGQPIAVTSVNHRQLRVRIFNVTPADWPTFSKYIIDRNINDGRDDVPVPAWPVQSDTVIDIGGDAEQFTETTIDLGPALGGKPGHVVMIVESTEKYSQSSNEYWANRPIITWAQSTNIGLDVVADSTDLLIWTTDLRTGAALVGSAVQAGDQPGSAATGSTDTDGLATLKLSRSVATITATQGNDTAILPAGFYDQGWTPSTVTDEARWHVFDDRTMYRPGETVSIKGWVRRLTLSADAQIELIQAEAELTYIVHDGQGNQLATGVGAVNALGGFDLQVSIPEDANLGYATVDFALTQAGNLTNATYSHGFQIQEFRRPEFDVAARTESAGPYVSTRPATVAVDATYYAGGPLAAAPVAWQVTTTSATYSPPDWDAFTFGIWQPWWYADQPYSNNRGGIVDDFGGCCWGPQEVDVRTFNGQTDATGSHYLQIDFEGKDGTLPDLPVTVSATATVTDVNRQAWTSQTNLLVHPGDYYVGLRSQRTFVRPGEPLNIDVIITDIDGLAVPNRSTTVTAARIESRVVDGQWTDVSVDPQQCTVTSATEPVPCSFVTSVGGTYKISAVVVDDGGGKSRSELTRWVSGAQPTPTRIVEQQSLTVIPDQETYAAGDTAQLLVQSPFANGEGLATIARNGIDSTIRFTLDNGSAIVNVPITERQVPNIDITVEVVGAAVRTADDGTPAVDAPLRPAYAVGALTLSIPPTARTLDVVATPRDPAVQPGQATQIDVAVTDAAGQPVVGAEFAIVVVDEAVLALSNYTLSDPIDSFYTPIYSYINAQYGRQSVVLDNPSRLSRTNDSASSDTTAAAATDELAAAPTDGVAGGNASAADTERSQLTPVGTPIDVRSNFDALAVFEPSEVTGADGTATVAVTLPDNLTRYRVMVVAASGTNEFGSDEANLTARLPLMVRPSAPRFANFGDRFELPVIVQNQTDTAMSVDVVLQTTNLTIDAASIGTTNPGGAGPDSAGVLVDVPANGRIEVRFPVRADQVGTARFRVAAVSGEFSDAATVELPVYTPATAEAFATYGVIDSGAISQPLLAPTDVFPQFGGLEVSTSSTSLQALTDAVLYISDYPFDSSDALASRILAITSLGEVLDAFDTQGLPSTAALQAAVKRDIVALAALQNDNGGFPYWKQFQDDAPFNSIQATHALVVAKANGYDVPNQTLQAALGYIASIEQHLPIDVSQPVRDGLSAYALYVRGLVGDRDTSKAAELYASRGNDLPVDALAWLWPIIDDPAISDSIETELNNRVVETAATANFTTTTSDDSYLVLSSDRRTDGIVLDALITQRPNSDLIPKVVAGLLAGQSKGRWDNIQENSFILLAMKRYFDTFESQTPAFVARVWLGDQFAGEHQFSGRETDRVRINVPMADVVASGDTDLILSKDGTGRLYYRLGLRYAPTDLATDPLDRGFAVVRSYEAVDDPADVSRDSDGTWHVKAGARVRVRLTMVAESQRTHVALIDPLPAGLEILNSELAVTEPIPIDDAAADGSGVDVARYPWPWWGVWFDHQNMRDDRAEAFATVLPGGTYDYSYVARATTPGTFVVPPTRAEEMYAPETFGRTSTDTLIVED